MKSLTKDLALLITIIAYSLKLAVLGATFADAACLVGLSVLSAVFYYIQHTKAKIIERDQLEEVRKLREEVAKEILKFKEDVIGEVNKVKIAANINNMRK